ncbi:hypothetical protein K432DRAFT_438838 [Lepidopterella palustris CBS 459.81]|uniref:Uncharacterized protein n=1 Tax=Lepidopterella palustris CBS 459.81 TaxID=1314670 RepID=A0A8E2ELK3_9PEZI|nr:hypothetical protein K432DRAFT_438838 [Lepidopterella palustris CBS 459.81]
MVFGWGLGNADKTKANTQKMDAGCTYKNGFAEDPAAMENEGGPDLDYQHTTTSDGKVNGFNDPGPDIEDIRTEQTETQNSFSDHPITDSRLHTPPTNGSKQVSSYQTLQPWEVLSRGLGFQTSDKESWWKANYHLHLQYMYPVFFYQYILASLGPCLSDSEPFRALLTHDRFPFRTEPEFHCRRTLVN